MMKRLLVIAVLGVSGLMAVQAQEKVKWHTITEALSLTGKEPRVLVIDVYTDWCGWCKRMDATTFTDPGVVEMMNKHFYPVKLDAEGKEDIVIGDRTFKFVDNGRKGYHELAAVVTQGRLSYPTLSYVGDQGRILTVAPGYKAADQLKIYLDYFSNGTYKTQEWEQFVESYTNTTEVTAQ